MDELYKSFIQKIKEKSNNEDDSFKLELLNNQSITRDSDSIIELKEYKKDFLTIGVVLLKKEIIKPIDYSNIDNIEIKSDTKYFSKILIIDDKYEIDNIMAKRFDDIKDARNYFNELNELINNNDLSKLIEIFNEKIS